MSAGRHGQTPRPHILPEHARLRRQQSQQTDALAARQVDHGGHGRIFNGAGHVAVDQRRVELAEALPERIEAHIRLVVAEARVINTNSVEHLDLCTEI